MTTVTVEHPTDLTRVKRVRVTLTAGEIVGFALVVSSLIFAGTRLLFGILPPPMPFAFAVGGTALWAICRLTEYYFVKRRVRTLKVPSELHQRWTRWAERCTDQTDISLSPDAYEFLAGLLPRWARLKTYRWLSDKDRLALDADITQRIVKFWQGQAE